MVTLKLDYNMPLLSYSYWVHSQEYVYYRFEFETQRAPFKLWDP